jgi:N-carbamoyl-L-amino-acid hydrolase
MLLNEIEKRAANIAVETKTKIAFIPEANFVKPALTDKLLQQNINESALSLGLKTKFMQSGAGHDTQQMANIAPVAMIFVPSVGGISHSPSEFTTAEDMTNGANVLLKTIMSVDRE